MAAYTGSDKRLAYLFGRTKDMQGATSESDGAQGIIPKPEAGDNLKFLRGDGEWAEAQAGDPSRELTQEEYDALTEEEKMNGTTYYITDGKNPPEEMALGNLSDVEINSPTDGQVLKYDAEHAEWVNGDEPDISGLETRMTAAEGNISDIQNQLVISKSASGSEVTFTDGANAPLLFCQADIVATQSGSGDPSPTNIRPISGFTGCNVTVSPTIDPNDGTVYPISWQTEAGTVYGGTVDFKTGLLTVTWKAIDLGSLSWSKSTATGATGAQFYSGLIPDRKIGSGSSVYGICSHYLWARNGTSTSLVSNLEDKEIGYYQTQTRAMIRDDDYINSTAEDFESAMSGVYLCYELEEPETYTLTPTQVEAVLGANYISADTGDISLTYLTQPYQTIVDLIRTMT